MEELGVIFHFALPRCVETICIPSESDLASDLVISSISEATYCNQSTLHHSTSAQKEMKYANISDKKQHQIMWIKSNARFYLKICVECVSLPLAVHQVA